MINICGENKMKVEESVYNGKLTWSPEFEILESKVEGGSQKLIMGGVALVKGLSRNKNLYKIENLKENHGREFKWLVGHPKDASPDFVIGKGTLEFKDDQLMHEGWIMNTAKYPDITEKVREGLIGPSIHASFDKIEPKKTEEGVEYHVKGLNIEGIGLVAFQGVKAASIDYAIKEALSLEDAELKNNASLEEEDGGETKMEEKIKTLEEQNAQLMKELEEMKLSKKSELVENICKINDKLVKEELMKESEEVLKLREAYEKELSTKEAAPAVEEVKKEEPKVEATIVEEEVAKATESISTEVVKEDLNEEVNKEEYAVSKKDGSLSFSESYYNEFNKSIKDLLI